MTLVLAFHWSENERILTDKIGAFEGCWKMLMNHPSGMNCFHTFVGSWSKTIDFRGIILEIPCDQDIEAKTNILGYLCPHETF